MERLSVAEPLRGSHFRGKAALNDGLGETDLQQSGAVQLVDPSLNCLGQAGDHRDIIVCRSEKSRACCEHVRLSLT